MPTPGRFFVRSNRHLSSLRPTGVGLGRARPQFDDRLATPGDYDLFAGKGAVAINFGNVFFASATL